jgi:hypothetical protein
MSMGGKSQPAAPDYSGLAASSEQAAKYGKEMGKWQLDFAKQQYADLKPMFERITESQLASQDQQMSQAQEYYDYLKQTFRPMERGMVRDAERFDSKAYREKLAGQAARDSGLAFRTQQQADLQAMMAMGVNPNSRRFAGLRQDANTQQAANRAGQMNATRMQADQLGWAKKLDAAGLGRNLPGASTAAYAGALGAGNSAGSNAMMPGNNLLAGSAMSAGTVQTGQNMQLQGLGQIAGNQTQMYGYNLNRPTTAGALGGLAGMALGGWGGSGFKGLL